MAKTASSRRILVWPDIHYPQHSVKAVDEALHFAKLYKPDIFVQLGDMFTANSVSSHDPNPRKHLRWVDERAESLNELDKLVKVLGPKCEKHITLGNHEDMLRRYIWRRAAALDGLIDIGDSFGLRERNFKVTPYRHLLKIGKVHFNHDIGGAGGNAAEKALQKVQGNIIQGHNHRAKVVYETNARGKAHFGCSAGWLGDPEGTIDYMPLHDARTQWSHNFVTLDMDPAGHVHLQMHPIFAESMRRAA